MTNIRKDQCIECGSSHLQKIDDTRTVCLNCGIIQNSELATPLVNDSKKNHVVQKTDSWLGHVRIRDSTEKRYAYALQEITRVCESQKLPGEICVKSAEILIELAKRRALKRHSLSVLSVASVYAACRMFGKNFNLKHASDCSEQPSRKIKREYVFIIKTLNIKPGKIESSEVLKALKNKIDLTIVEKILESYKGSKRVGGKSPRSLAAAASYIAAQIKGCDLSQREISNSVSITERALRTSYKDMIRKLEFNILI